MNPPGILFSFVLGICLSGMIWTGVCLADESPKQIRNDIELANPVIDESGMSHRLTLLVGYSAAIVLASMLGGYLPSRLHLTHTRLQLLMSFVGGLMLGVALFHLLMHAVIDSPVAELPQVMSGVGLGIVIMFLLLRAFHFHQHDISVDSVAAEHADHEHRCGHEHADHQHAHINDSLEICPSNISAITERPFSWMGIAFGLGLHTIMDGVALTASCLRTPADGEQSLFWGLATFLAILLHKPLDAISITTVMLANGFKPSTCTIVNISFAVMCPVGAALAWWGIFGLHSHVSVVCFLLAFSAGVFMCISLSDLLPEMQFHAHNQWGLTITLLAGMALAWGLMFLDPHGT